MTQHPLDLLPAVYRQRTQAGLRSGQFIAAGAVMLLALIGSVTHARLSVKGAEDRLFAMKASANQVIQTEEHVAQLRKRLAENRAFIERYRRIALPVDVSAVLATAINAMPSSVTLDQVDVSAGMKAVSRSPRSKGSAEKTEAPPRMLSCELSGFAASDEHIAEMVNALTATQGFRNVSLDFSRTRDIRGRIAREFRVSFDMDLDATYVAAGAERDASKEVVSAHE